jgi:hypothetical protein
MIKIHRATIGARIGGMFLEIVELAYHAYYSSPSEKLPIIVTALKKVDVLKLLITIAWEGNLIQTVQFSELTEKLQEISKMLGGWKRGLESKATLEH